MVAGSTGFIYDFSIYSGALKLHFNLSQSQLDWIATAGCLTFFVSPLSGHFVDTYGPRSGLLIGGFCMTVGLTLQFLFSRDLIFTTFTSDPTRSTLLLCGFACLTSIGANAASAVAYSLPPKLFPLHRGRVTGIVKAFAGLTGGLMAQIYILCVGPPSTNPETLSFLLFLGSACFVINIVITPWLFPSGTLQVHQPVPMDMKDDDDHDEVEIDVDIKQRLQRGYFVVVILIALIFICSLLTAVPTTNATMQHNITNNGTAIITTKSVAAFTVVGTFILTMVLVGFAISYSSTDPHRHSHPHSNNTKDDDNSTMTLEQNLLDVPLSSDSKSIISFTNADADADADKNVNTFTMLGEFNFYLVLISGMAAVGGGYMITTNSFQMIQSSNIIGASAGTAISMFSACQGLSRMLGGVGPELFMPTGEQFVRQIRPLFLILFCLMEMVGHLLLWWAPRVDSLHILYLGYCFAGIGFGGVWPIMVTLSADLWGLKHLGANYMVFDGTTALIGSLICGKLLPQSVYSSNSINGDLECHGSKCFGLAHVVILVVNLMGAVAAGLLYWRRRKW